MKALKVKLSRRHFLLAAGASAASAAAIVARKEPDGTPSQDNTPESKKGYQLTEHVRNYYRTAKI